LTAMSNNSASFTIRQLDIASATDLQILSGFCQEWAQSDRFWNTDEVVKSVRESGAILLGLADKSGLIRGIAMYLMAGDVADLLYLYVKLEDRRTGLGEVLLSQSLEALVKRAVQSVVLEVRHTNESALRLYAKVGFARLTIRPRYYRDGDDAVIMEWKAKGE